MQTALSLNPNESEIMADLGRRYAMLTEWDKAVPLLEDAYRRNPALPGNFRTGLSLFHLAHGRYEEALKEARKVKAPQVVYIHILKAAAAAGLGLQGEVASAVHAIRLIDPGYGRHIVTDLQKRHLHPDLIALIVDLLKHADLRGSEDGARVIRLPKPKPARTAVDPASWCDPSPQSSH